MNYKEIKKFHEDCRVVDMHCHPSLKMHLFGAKFGALNNYNHPMRSTGFDPKTFQVSYPKMVKGGMDIIFSSIYLPEHGFIDFSTTVCVFMPVLELAFSKIMNGIEKVVTQNLHITKQWKFLIILKKVLSINEGFNFIAIPKNLEEFEEALSDNKKIVLHSIEGAHSLGRFTKNEITQDKVEVIKTMKERINLLLSRGVCLMTIGHFFRNNLTESCKGFPPSMDALLFDYQYDKNIGLSEIGIEIVEYMLEEGMIVDLVHCTRTARKQIFDINNNHRPLVFSHAGISKITENNGKEIELNVTDKEIMQIHECGGTIGIIFNNYLLTGIEDSVFGSDSRKGVKSILRSMNHVRDVTDSYENISIGTDFDGFTDPPDDFPDILDMPEITAALIEKSIPREEIKNIMGLNSIRVLRNGWR